MWHIKDGEKSTRFLMRSSLGSPECEVQDAAAQRPSALSSQTAGCHTLARAGAHSPTVRGGEAWGWKNLRLAPEEFRTVSAHLLTLAKLRPRGDIEAHLSSSWEHFFKGV